MTVLCYRDPSEMAGLNDRRAVISNLLKWAWALNATLNLEPPCKMLAAVHNRGIPISCNVTWDRYFDIEPKRLLTYQPCSVQLSSFYSLASHVRVLETKAIPVHLAPSRFVIQQAETFAQDSALPAQYDMIHIRRTDAISECNTSLSRMRGILKTHAFKTTHVLYGTDETDQNYNDNLIRVLQDRLLTVYDVESTLRMRFPTDNYMAYSIGHYLMQHAVSRHEWRREFSCPQA